MAKKKDITVDNLKQANTFKSVQNKVINCAISDTQNINIKVKKYITLKEYHQMGIDIVYMVFGAGENIYCPTLLNFAIDYYVLRTFTNIQIKNSEVIYHWIQSHKEIMQDIYAFISVSYADIEKDVSALIQYKIAQMQKESKWEKIADMLYPLLENLSNLSGTIDKMNPDDWNNVIGAVQSISNFETKDFERVVANTIKNKDEIKENINK